MDEDALLSISDTSIAEIQDGKIIAKKAGATVLVVSKGDKKKEYEFKVKDPSITDENVEVNNNFTLNASITQVISDTQISLDMDYSVYPEGVSAKATLYGQDMTMEYYYVDDVAYGVFEEDGSYYYYTGEGDDLGMVSQAEESVTTIKSSFNLKLQFETLDWTLKESKKENGKLIETFKNTDGFIFFANLSSEISSCEMTFEDSILHSMFLTYEDDSTLSGTFKDIGSTSMGHAVPKAHS